MKSFLSEVLITVLLALLIFFGARATIQTFVVVMTSMEPNFHEGERLVVNLAVYKYLHEPQRGDVVIFKAPNGEQDDFIKRIIGLPGDTVEIKNKAVYVNDVKLNEPYLADPPGYTMALREVPADNYFVLGDNRNHSNDSHYGWFLPRENIIGKAWLRTWPPAEWGIVPDYPLGEQLDNTETAAVTYEWLTAGGLP